MVGPLRHRRPRGARLRSPACALWPRSLLGCTAGHADRAASKGLGQLWAGSGTGSWTLGPGSSNSRSQKKPEALHGIGGIGGFEERREKRTKNGCREEGAAGRREGGPGQGGGAACWCQGQEFRCATLGDLGHILAHVGRTDWTDLDPCTTRVPEQLSCRPPFSATPLPQRWV